MSERSGFIITEVKIRRAVVDDVESLAMLLAELGYPTEGALGRNRFIDLTAAGDCILVAEYSAKVIGMALLHCTHFLHRPPDGRISTLVVFKRYRNRGIGARLIREAEMIFREWGCGRVEVTSGAQRESVHGFYLRQGYEEQSKRFIKSLSPVDNKKM